MGNKEVKHIRVNSEVHCYSYGGDLSKFLGQMEEDDLDTLA
jgi:hypothetical protein